MPPWLQLIFDLLLGGPTASTGEVLLRSALILTSLLAVAQWLTMFATRWGDHHAMAKSFVLSVVVHLCLGLGWATVVQTNRSLQVPAEEPTPIPIRQVLLESDQPVAHPDDGSTPFWQQPLDVPDRPLARSDRAATAVPLESPVRAESDPASLPPTEMAQLPTLPREDTPQPQAQPAELATTAPSVAQSADLADNTATAREEMAANPSAATRQTLSRTPTDPLLQTDPLPQPAPVSPGAALRSATEPTVTPLAVPLPTDSNPTVPRPVGPLADAMNRPASPAATPAETPDLGDAPSATRSPAGGPSGTRPAFTRSTRSPAAAMSRNDIARIDTPRPSELEMTAPGNLTRRPVMTDRDATPVPELVRSRPADAPLGDRAQAATTYRLRRLERRREIALRNGGTVESEKAVENALAFLARIQQPEGYWDADRHGGGLREVRQIDPGKPPGGTEADTGVTGLAVLAYLGAGYTHEEGEYEQTVSKAVQWLIAQQRTDGYLGGTATYYDQMYCHGIAVYALAEAYGMQNDPTQNPALREAVARGVWYISETQNTDGGWRYRVGASLSDMSMFGWQLMALKSAELAGIPIPTATRTGMIQFLRERSRGNAGGLAGYKQESPPTPAMTGEAFFCKLMYGLRRNSATGQESSQYLQANLPQLQRPDEYYWYYGTLAMFQYGGPSWEAWNQSLRDILVRMQRSGGELNGSWDPIGPWGSVGGRVYSTALSTMCLEVYYRFLPLYQVGSPDEP